MELINDAAHTDGLKQQKVNAPALAERIQLAAAAIQSKLSDKPTIGLILGSGLGVLADHLQQKTTIPYDQIAFFPASTVHGHAGQLAAGKLGERNVIVMQGRFHQYEGYSADTVAFPVHVMQKLGVKTLLVTNAAGGINTTYRPGDLMLLSDHINLMYRNPLIGSNDDTIGPRFPDMSEAYSKSLRKLAQQAAAELGFTLREGVYAGVLGPSYETPAEIRMMRILGADAVGMSTVPEVIAARHIGLDVLGISCISNMASGILEQPLSHSEVIETTEQVKEHFLALVAAIVKLI